MFFPKTKGALSIYTLKSLLEESYSLYVFKFLLIVFFFFLILNASIHIHEHTNTLDVSCLRDDGYYFSHFMYLNYLKVVLHVPDCFPLCPCNFYSFSHGFLSCNARSLSFSLLPHLFWILFHVFFTLLPQKINAANPPHFFVLILWNHIDGYIWILYLMFSFCCYYDS